MKGPRLHGIAAEFACGPDLEAAVEALRGAGYTRIDAYAPFPMRGLEERLGIRTSVLAWIAAGAAVVGALVQYGAQVWFNAVDYPLNVGGRPLHSWPAFLPSTLIVSVMWAGAATLLSMLLLLGLPRLHHPIFALPGFERASQDRFFVCVRGDDPRFDAERLRDRLLELKPLAVTEVET